MTSAFILYFIVFENANGNENLILESIMVSTGTQQQETRITVFLYKENSISIPVYGCESRIARHCLRLATNCHRHDSSCFPIQHA